jgi:hypothetical protein
LDKLPTVVHSLGEETAAGPQDKTVTKGDLIPTKLAHYRVLQKLGQGGMGWVLLAEDTQLHRKVALKVMRSRLAADKESCERFLREARAAAALRHDNVVTIYQVYEDRGIPFFAMELLEGGTLQQRLEYPKPLSIGTAVRIAREIAQGLQVAHERGVLHRDIKPANIWLEAPRGRVKILDFGLARQMDAKSGLTHAGEIVGTPHYMSPEQARARATDPRTDLFSLGCILYRMTTGKLPFAGETLLATLTAIAVDTPTPVIQLNPQVPHVLADLIERLLAKDPAARHASAEELIEELTAIERDLAPGNRSGFSVDVPAAILVQTRPKAAPPAAAPAKAFVSVRQAQPKAASPLAVGALAARLPAAQQALAAWWRGLRHWQQLAAIAAVPLVVVLLLVGVWQLATTSDATPAPPKAAGPRPSIPQRGVTALQPSLAASRVAAEWVLTSFGPNAAVQVQLAGNPSATSVTDAARLPSEPFELVAVELSGCAAVRDADLAHLSGVSTLAALDLADTTIGDAGLAQLEGIPALTSLTLTGTKVSDRGVARVVERCPMLKRLDLGHTACTSGVAAAIKPLHQLEGLSLAGLPIGDAQLRQIAAQRDLKTLDLTATAITAKGLAALDPLSSLINLVLTDTAVGDEGAAALTRCQQLEIVALNGCELSDAALEPLARLPRLGWLEIKDNPSLRDAALDNLARARSLRRLVVTNGVFSQTARDRLKLHLPQCEIKLIDASSP